MFNSASDSANSELEARRLIPGTVLRFGIDYLDDSLRGIERDDLILLGAMSGVGKTQLCCNIALANLAEGKKVHYIALEASKFEIERRLKFPLVAERYYSDPQRPKLSRRLNYADWKIGTFLSELEEYEQSAAQFFETAYRDFLIHYKAERFGVNELINAVQYCAKDTGLVMIDHVHYFDFDDDNENRAIREIAKVVRDLTRDERVPILLVAHMRKRDARNDELVPGYEEFHGTSDLFKIATKVITVGPGRQASNGSFETFFRTPKNRNDMSVSRFCAKEFYTPKGGSYEKNKYSLGWAEQKRSRGFESIAGSLYPDWAIRCDSTARSGGNDFHVSKGNSKVVSEHGRSNR